MRVVACFLLISVLFTCDKLIKYQEENPDNFIEEIAEEIIEEIIDIDIDLTPSSKENHRSY